MKVQGEFLEKRKQMKKRGQRGEETVKVQVNLKKCVFYARLNRAWSNSLFFTIYINKNVRQTKINTSKIIKLSSPH